MTKKISKCMRRVLAAALVLTLAAGLVPFQPAADMFTASITASAAQYDAITPVYDSETKTLTIPAGTYNNPRIAYNKDYTYAEGVKVTAESGTVFKGSCSELFQNINSLTSVDMTNMNFSGVTDMSDFFGSSTRLEEITFGEFDTSSVTNMSNFFRSCYSLKSVDLSKFDTSKVTDMHGFLKGCSSLTEVDLSELDTSNVTDMSHFLSGCWSLTEVDLSELDTSNITDMSYFLSGCRSLTEVDLSELNDTSKVTDMSYFLSDCSSLTEVDLSELNDTSKVTDMHSFLKGCKSLTNISVQDFDAGSATDISSFFSGCEALEDIDLSGFKTNTASDVSVYMDYFFNECSALKNVTYGGSFDTKRANSMSSFYAGCTSMTDFGLSNLDTRNAEYLSCFFCDCESLTEIDLSGLDTSSAEDLSGMFEGCDKLTKLTIPDGMSVTEDWRLRNHGADADNNQSFIGWKKSGETEIISGDGKYAKFSGAGTYVFEVSPIEWDYDMSTLTLTLTSGIYDTNALSELRGKADKLYEENYESYGYEPYHYEYYPSIANIVVKDGVTITGDCSAMFDIYRYAVAINEFTVSFDSGVKFENITNMRQMLSGTHEVNEVNNVHWGTTVTGFDPSKIDTSKVTDMSMAFAGCNIDSLDLSTFDTSKVADMTGMFKGTTVKSITFGSGFDTSNVTDMREMFKNCSGLESLDISGFDTSKVTDMTEMFSGCTGLRSLTTGDKFNINNLSTSGLYEMFGYCASLEAVDLSSFTTSGGGEYYKVQGISNMFYGCSSIEKIDLSAMDMSQVYDMGSAFFGCSKLKEIKLGEQVDSYCSSYNAFEGCDALTSLKLPEGLEISESSKLQNNNALFTAWHKQGSDEYVGGEGDYAVFTAEGETYVRDLSASVNTVKGVSLTLEGQIGLNFYAAFPESILNDKDAYVELSAPKGTQTIKISDAAIVPDSGYKFTYRLAAKELHDQVSFKVYNGSGELQALYNADNAAVSGDTYSYAIADYISAVQNDESGNYSDELKTLVNALESYGTYAQIYFEYDTASAKTDSLKNADEIAAVSPDHLSSHKAQVDDYFYDECGFTGYSLILDSETSLRLYFSSDKIKDDIEDSDYTFRKLSDDRYYVEWSDISAQRLANSIYISSDTSSGEYQTMYCSPLSYAYSALKQYGNNPAKTNLCNTMRAMYLYYQAAYAYFG